LKNYGTTFKGSLIMNEGFVETTSMKFWQLFKNFLMRLMLIKSLLCVRPFIYVMDRILSLESVGKKTIKKNDHIL
jgi:hypothetical protein